MARLKFSIPFIDVALAVNAWKTLCSVRAPTQQMLALMRAKFATDGISGSEKSLSFRFNRVTPGTGTATTITPSRLCNAYTATVQSVCRNAFTAEPTDLGTPDSLLNDRFHPQGGLVDIFSAADLEVIQKEGTEVAMQVFVPTGGSSSLLATGHLVVEE